MRVQVLEGGDVNDVVRVGDTVRRPTGSWSPAAHALPPAPDRRGRRLRAICDASGLDERADLIERAIAKRRGGYELHRRLGGEERRPGWCDRWDAGSGETALEGIRWLEEHRSELEEWLA